LSQVESAPKSPYKEETNSKCEAFVKHIEASYFMSLKLLSLKPKVGIWDGKMFFPLYTCK
jgi:hypothetical protein